MDPSKPDAPLDAFFIVSPELLAFIDSNGHFIRINPAWSNKTGYPAEELIGRHFSDHIPENERAKTREVFEQFKDSAQVVQFKSLFDCKGGTSLFLEWQCIRLDHKSPLFLSVFDLTSLKEIEKALSESRENYRLLADCVSEGVVLSEDGIIIEANSAFGRMAWMDPGDVIGKNVSVLVPPDHRKRLLDDLLEGADEGYEITGIRKNGTIFPLEVRTRFVEHRGRKIRVNLLRDITDKKRLVELSQRESAQALQAQEKVFAALTQNTSELIVIVDSEGRLKYTGGGNQALLGYEETENIGRSLFELIHPEDAPQQIKKFFKLLKKPGAMEMSYFRIRHKNESWRHMEVTAHNLLDEPTVRGVVCNVRDISEKIHAQERLMESERFHRALSENALDVVLIHDGEGMIRYISPSIRGVLGLDPSELMGKSIFAYLHSEDLPSAMVSVKKMVEGDSAHAVFEQRVRHSNGSWRYVEWISQNLLHDPVVDGIVVNLRDVTDRKKAEKGLLASEAQMRGVFNSTSQLFELIDLKGKLVAFNEVAKNTHQKLFGQILRLGSSAQEFVPLGFRDKWPTFMTEAQTGEIHHREVMIRDTEAKEHWFDITTNPVRDDQGFIVGICLAATLVDERKEAEEKILHVERLAAIGQVTGAIAHEMRNPLSVITALSKEKILEGDEDAKRLVFQAEKLARLMEDILDFSRRTVLAKEPLSAVSLFQSAIASARVQAGKAADGVTLRWEGIADDQLWGDRVRLEQVFHNLLLNAFQALSGHGQMVLTCRREDPMMVLTVEDDGPGLPEKDMERVFEPFFTTKKLGTGLGLAISRKIIEDHGGTLEASLRNPKGMSMRVTLPAVVNGNPPKRVERQPVL
jgi:PAS domain S-box-containing protein